MAAFFGGWPPVDHTVGGHTRLEDVIGCDERELDTENQLETLFGCLDVLGRELRLVMNL
jgi:hypothetical protein